MSEVKMGKWELVDRTVRATTERLKIDGGYLYHVAHQEANAIAMCFVPDVDLARYQSHLRDAYNKGFADGMEEARKPVKGEV